MQNDYKLSQLNLETRITQFGALPTKFPISWTLIPNFNLHQQWLQSQNHEIMQKRNWRRCRNSNLAIHGRKRKIDDLNSLGNIKGWWMKFKNKSRSLNHVKFEWNRVSVLNMNEKNPEKCELMKWWWNWVCDGSNSLEIIPGVSTNLRNSRWLRNKWEIQWNSN